MLFKFLILLTITFGLVASEQRYDGYKSYRLAPKTEKQLDSINQLLQDISAIKTLDVTYGNNLIDIIVPPNQDKFINLLAKNRGLELELRLENIQELIDEEQTNIKLKRSEKDTRLEWTEYHDLDDIYAWLDELAAGNPNVKTLVAGTTYEKREIRGITIKNGDRLPGVIIEAGIHAREWIGPAASSWIVNEILNSPNNSIWRQYNYLYIPVFNPDGYAYTFSNDRLWRKTRKPYNNCVGADPNRNYDNHWQEGGGSSNDPCSETYAGPQAFSEVETKSLSDFFKNVSSDYDIYVAFHSYAQLMLFPWGWTSQHAPLYDLWKRVGDLSAAAIKAVHGTEFVVGDVYTTIYPASATSTDWYYGAFNSTLTYTWETRDTIYGFQLPARQIIPVGEEHLEGLRVLLEEYQKL